MSHLLNMCLSVLCRSSTAVRCLQTIGFLPSWCTSAKIQDGRSKTNTRKWRVTAGRLHWCLYGCKRQIPVFSTNRQSVVWMVSGVVLVYSSRGSFPTSTTSFSERKMLKSLVEMFYIMFLIINMTHYQTLSHVSCWALKLFLRWENSVVTQSETTSVWLVWVIIIKTSTDRHRHVLHMSASVFPLKSFQCLQNNKKK